uniref:Copia protein n=1 Tax=Tanacetum cinerariifolium TaxID=118510 RepID=A0A6L2LW90_TANCI|nr:copia protein [Tanacetum cinerariifolium]
MDLENYKEGKSMQRPPLFEANCFIYWKNRFETYVKSKDIDLWYIIVYDNYKPTIKDKYGSSAKWRPKVTIIEESKDLSTLPLDELIGNLKVYDVVLEKDLEISRNTKEKYKPLALKARKVLSEEEATSLDINDEEYAMAQRKIKKRKMIEDVSSVVTQITSLVIVQNTLSMIKRRSLLDVGAIVNMTPKRKKYVSWLLMIMSTKSTEGIFLGYSPNSKDYDILNRETMRVEESLNLKFDESPPPETPPLEDDDVLENKNIERQEKDLKIKENKPLNKESPNIKESKDHPLETIIGVETIVYADSDHAGDYINRKSTSDVCTFMRCCLTSCFSKKQTALAISTTEAEYVSAGKACQQALWMKQALVDYDINLDNIPVLYDNKGTIDLSKNPVLYSRTKHIEIRHHFLRDILRGQHC